jgi:hypothetical protein
MKEKLQQLKEKLTECGILEAQESNTAYEQAEKEDKVFKKEDDKSYKEDRLDLEEILNSTGKKKKDYIRRVIKTVNGMIDGKKDVDNLITVVKQGKGNVRRI